MSVESKKLSTYKNLIRQIEEEHVWALGKLDHHGSGVIIAEALAGAAGLTERELDTAFLIGNNRAAQRIKEGRL